ncbi:10407_t:CDS:2 [Funneliformis caledonium]|uniref:10407_t:CDS:1 n=1 Tax=Funneliformis caledonium TaxID=1117310 RepID=A0A9N8V8J5_9GLOM|nr:10407_t:CDS:2 [Funneliformis caledonium]
MEYDHTSDLHQDFLNLLENSEDYNVKFEIGKEPNIKEFEAHSIILSARSTYFQRTISKYWNEEKEVLVFKKPNISPLIFEILLKYIYTGTLSVDDEASFADVIVAADEFELQTLVQQLEKHLIQNESAWQLPKDFITICQHKQFPNLGKYALDLAFRGRFKSILPSGLDAEVVRYFLNLNANPSFNVLKPRVSDYPFDSKIVNAKDAALISSWIDDKQENPYHFNDLPYEFKLIYRASSEGFSVNNFHNNCDDKGPTVVVIKVRNSKEIIGGYNPLGWRSIKTENVRSYLLSYNDELYSNHKCETSSSFIFSLTNREKPILSKVSSKDGAIMWSKRKGPCFSKDLCIYDGSSSESSYNNLFGSCKQCSYEKEITHRKNFQLEDYEVFQIINKGCNANKNVENLNYRNVRNCLSKSLDNDDINLVDIIIAADDLGLSRVGQQLEPFLLQNETAWNLPKDFLAICKHNRFPDLVKYALDSMCKDPQIIFESKEFLRMEDMNTDNERSPLLSFDYSLHKTSNSFIFSLTNRSIPILSRVSSKREAILCDTSRGPRFGLKDLCINDVLSREGISHGIIVGTSKLHSYEKKIIHDETFEIEEYEVFQIIDTVSELMHDENSHLLSPSYSLYKTSNSFIFSLTNRAIPILSRVSSENEAILCSNSKGPCFGLKDLCVTHSLSNIVGISRQYSYEKKIINNETFEIEEYEVFQILDKRSDSL